MGTGQFLDDPEEKSKPVMDNVEANIRFPEETSMSDYQSLAERQL